MLPITVSTGYTSQGIYICRLHINKSLEAGWKLFEIQKINYGEPNVANQDVIYQLGNTNQKVKTFKNVGFSREVFKESLREHSRTVLVEV